MLWQILKISITKALEILKINQYVLDQELVMMIDQASSPSFFLAEEHLDDMCKILKDSFHQRE